MLQSAMKTYMLLVVHFLASGTQATRMSYGTGMACSYFEGYLNHVIPSSGPDARGLVDNIHMLEAMTQAHFPVKTFFIVITRSMHCPPNLEEFNRDKSSYLEVSQPLVTIERDATGAVRRSYRTATYVVRRPGQAAVHAAVECATPLHTLYKASQNPTLSPVFEDVDIKEEIADFSTALHTLINASPVFRDRCELIYYNDTDKNQNLADLLLAKMQAMEPDFKIHF